MSTMLLKLIENGYRRLKFLIRRFEADRAQRWFWTL